eukprot:scaffold4343_cov195-Alexandrium_tamarense.AAC.7
MSDTADAWRLAYREIRSLANEKIQLCINYVEWKNAGVRALLLSIVYGGRRLFVMKQEVKVSLALGNKHWPKCQVARQCAALKLE